MPSAPREPGAVLPADGYSTVADLRATLNPTGEAQSGTGAVLADTELRDAIYRADAEVDAYLSGPYAVPLAAPVPSLVEQISTDIAAWDATLRYRRGVPLDPNDPVRLRGVEARKLLERISSGKIDLVGITGTVATAGDAAVVNPYSAPFWSLESFGLSDPLR